MRTSRQNAEGREDPDSYENSRPSLFATTQKIRLSDIKLADLSLALAGLMWVVPFLLTTHRLPLTTFDQEWWSALLGVLALGLLLARDSWLRPEIPRIVQLPVALIAVVWAQRALGKIVYFDQALLYSMYLLFAALLMMLGARLRGIFGMARLAEVLAVFLLIGAELSALIGIQQHYRLLPLLDSFTVAKIDSGVFGNLAQPNHFANYIALGLVSLGLLHQQRRLKAFHVAVLAAPLLLVMTLSGSRSSWLYLVMMAGLAWWWARRDAALRPLLRYGVLLIAGFGLMHLAVQIPFMASTSSGSVNTVQRMLADETGSGSIRLYLWREALVMLAQSPVLGVGFGQFAWHHFQLAPVLHPPGNIVGLYNNAHNLILQLAAETGAAGLLALAASIGAWLYGLQKRFAIFGFAGPAENNRHRAPLEAAYWWGMAALGVQAIHSLLEYPQWYVYFVAIAALLFGALDETRYRLKFRVAGYAGVAAALLLGVVALIQSQVGHRELQRALAIRPESMNDDAALGRIRNELLAAKERPLLSPYAELPLSGHIQVSGDQIEEKLATNGRVLRFIPVGSVAYRQALLLAQAGRQREAMSLMEQAIWSYPNGFEDAAWQLRALAGKDPEHFSALLEFALQKEQEHRRAVRH